MLLMMLWIGLSLIYLLQKETLDVIKLKDVYEDMEVISDKCEDASNVIESIIIKYA